MKHALTLLAAALLAACAGPEPKKPTAAEAAQAALPAATFADAGGSGTAAAALPWAQAFQGPRLQQLIPLALANNRDLRVAAANIESARATASARDADLWPTVNAGISGSRTPTASGGIASLYQAGLQVTAYEVDLFGRLRNAGAAAQAQLLAAEANQQAVRNALVAAVATAEIALQADEALLRITRDTLASREQSLGLIRQRFEGGITSELDLRAGESALQAARVALAQTQRQRALDENALVLLLGSALPANLPAPTGLLADFEPLAELPAGVPSEVLTRRPDIRQAERQLVAADANIGAARAAFFPRITLTGSFGTASNQLDGLFKNTAWSFAPSLIQPLFDAGRNRANLAGARAARDAATAQYEKAVQSAFRDVADALAGRTTLAEQRTAQAALVDAEARRLALAEERYRAGISSSLDVLDAQRSLFAARQALVQVQSLRAQNLVAVYRVLGGGGLTMGRFAFALALLLMLPAAQAQETLRDRIKARIEQRRAEKGSDTPTKGGLQELQIQGRKVLVHLPTAYDAAKPAPLVLAFHGGGGHAEYMADDEKYGLQRKADEAGFIVAFPNGYSKLPNAMSGKFATWNAGGCCGDARDRNVDDVDFARAVVKTIQARYSIDAARVFATGMSNGGMLSHRLACEAADVFRAVASVAGTDATASCTPSKPISVLHIHAKDDDHVLFNGGAGPNAFRDESKVMNFISVPETISRWVQRDRCAMPPQRVLDKPGASCEAYSGCAGGVSVQLCVTDTGGHSWPGADSVIWRFFEQASR